MQPEQHHLQQADSKTTDFQQAVPIIYLQKKGDVISPLIQFSYSFPQKQYFNISSQYDSSPGEQAATQS